MSAWCKEEGIFDKKIKDPAHEWVILVRLPSKLQLQIVQPNDKPFIVISCRVNIAPQHLNILSKSPAKFANFRAESLEYICTRPLDLAFDPKSNKFFNIADRIFLDGLSQQVFFSSIREIVHAFQKIIIILNRICGQKDSGKSATVTGTMPGFYG
ncbi:MAG: DUF2299 family protein [Candidatus Helarchaeota archaeon]